MVLSYVGMFIMFGLKPTKWFSACHAGALHLNDFSKWMLILDVVSIVVVPAASVDVIAMIVFCFRSCCCW